jgi:hypothetical protein
MSSGCGHPTLNVVASKSAPPITSADQDKNLPGIPFYAKKGVCKRETIFIEPRFIVDVEISRKGDSSITHEMTLSRSEFKDDSFKNLLADLKKLSDADEKHQYSGPDTCYINDEWGNVFKTSYSADDSGKVLCDVRGGKDKCKSLDSALNDGSILHVSTNSSIEAQVDYSQVYYLNSRTPWIGNSSVDAKLQADGTLNEGNVAANDQTWSTILNTIGSVAGDLTSFGTTEITAHATSATPPANNVALNTKNSDFEKIFGDTGKPDQPKCDPPKSWPIPSDKITYKISITPKFYLHDLLKYETDTKELKSCQKGIPITDWENTSVTITLKDDAKSKDDTSFKFSGQVTPPKPNSTN